MNKAEHNIRSERYSSRYTRGFLKMLVNDGQVETDKYVTQFYSSKNYQGRLEAIKYLIGVIGKYPFPESIFLDALNDFCSQVKVYVLQHYDFSLGNREQIQASLVDIAKNDEKVQLRALAMERLASLDATEHYELFFSTSLLKSSKESAAGLLGLHKIDKEKAYQMAKFRAETSSGNLDLAIAQIFESEGNSEDLGFFKTRLQQRTKFNKIDLTRIYLRLLGRIGIEAVTKTHILYICENVAATGNTEVVQRLIMELYHFISDNKVFLAEHDELLKFVNKTIDLLLEKDYLKTRKPDPFGPL
ncbi:MAG: hypothetical protein ACO1NS_14510 [Daejeonella sp.]|uniref:hypothetical protein n=1 Tax=Daejeonella sp. JGW-45 TaxID=3034148 RepID=UPI0023EBA562|nr:hypothetical protein [Daejeonella sp. JGW-45]